MYIDCFISKTFQKIKVLHLFYIGYRYYVYYIIVWFLILGLYLGQYILCVDINILRLFTKWHVVYKFTETEFPILDNNILHNIVNSIDCQSTIYSNVLFSIIIIRGNSKKLSYPEHVRKQRDMTCYYASKLLHEVLKIDESDNQDLTTCTSLSWIHVLLYTI